MKTNFEYLNKLLDEVNDKLTDQGRYLRDLNFLLVQTEKKIYKRELIESTYALRMAWDLSRQFIMYMIRNSDEKVMKKWNQNIKDFKKPIIDSYKRRNRTYVDTTPGYKTLLDEYPSHVSNHIDGAGSYSDVIRKFRSMNKWMHYEYDSNFKADNNALNKNDNSTLYFHRGEVRFRKPKFDEVVEYLETIWYVVVKVITESKMFADLEIEPFDRDIYNNIEYALYKLGSNKYIDKLVNDDDSKCPICNEGKFHFPDIEETMKFTKFPYGAYISCDKEGCWAKVDLTLKVKKKLVEDEDDACPTCKEPKLQLRSNLRDESKAVYKACSECSWNDKELIDDGQSIDEMVEQYQMDLYDWMDEE